MCLLDTIIDNSKDVFIDITTYPVVPSSIEYKYGRALLKERHDYWEKARKTHSSEICLVKEKLEDEFRNILGINVRRMRLDCANDSEPQSNLIR